MADQIIDQLDPVSGSPTNTDLVLLEQGVGSTPVYKKWSIAQMITWMQGLFVQKNADITGATKTKITYDAKGLVTSGADATTADIADSINKRYVTDSNLIVIGNTSGTNTGDETNATIKTKLGVATYVNDGFLDKDDWTYFDNKQNPLVAGTNITIDNTDPLNPVISSAGGGGATNLGYTASPTNGIVTSDTGTDATLTIVDGTNAGLVTPTMKSTWDGKQDPLGYTPENVANKDANSGYVGRDSSGGLSVVDVTVTSATASTPVYFSSAKKLITLTSQLWGTFVQTFTSKSTPVDADTITIFDNSDTFNAKKTTLTQFWTNYLKPKNDAQYWIQGGNTLSAETIFGGTSGAFGLDIRTNNLTALKILSSPASATNYLTIQSATTANHAILGADGSTSVGLIIQAKGSESIYLKNTGAGGTLKLKWYDSSGSTYRDVITEIGTSNGVGIATGFTTVNTASNFNLGNNAILRAANNVIKIVGSSSTTSSVGVVFGTNSANFGAFAPTSGTHYLINMWSEANNSFSPTSGNANMRMIDLSAFTINQTGTATGNVSLINLNPTVTSVTGSLYSIKSSLLSGTNIYNLYIDGTAINYLNGNTSIKTTTSTAFLTIGGGTVANSALRLIAGSMPTGGNILDGNINYDGSNLRLTVNTTDFTLVKALTGSAVLDFPSIAASGFQDLTVTVTGASIGDIVSIGEDNSVVGSNIFYKGFISAANTVTIRAFNTHPSNAYDPTSATFKIIVQKI